MTFPMEKDESTKLSITPDGILSAMSHFATKDEVNTLRRDMQRFEDKVDARFDKVDVRFDKLEGRIDKLMFAQYAMILGIIGSIITPVVLKFV